MSDITKRSIYSWIFYKNTKLQIILLLIIGVTVAARVFPLEMQKRIINKAIGMKDFELLLLYCGLYLFAVVLAGVLKFVINAIQNYIGQRTLVHIREQVYDHVMSLPLPFFRRTQPGLVISSLTSELAAVAEFVGSALAVPVVNILTLLAFAGYMFYLNPLLAIVSLSIYPVEMLIIPKLQRKANKTNRERINETRKLSGLIGETISGIHEVHGNGSYNLELKRFSTMAKELFRLNYRMNIFKYGIKFTNNFFQSLGPFILFLLGGYLAINGRFDLGALVAFLSAYEKVYDPWKELMDFYQVYQDSLVRYKNVMEYFDEQPDFAMTAIGREPYQLTGDISMQDVHYVVGGNIRLLDRVNLNLKAGEHLAVVGFSGSGKSTMALTVAQIYKNTAGTITLGGHDLSTLTKQDVATNIGVVAQHPFIFNGTIRENLLYSCQALVDRAQEEGREPVGCELPDLDRMIEAVQQVGLFQDVLVFGLRTVISKGESQELVATIIQMRKQFQERYGEDLAKDVEFNDPEAFMHTNSVAVNILFADPVDESFAVHSLHKNEFFLEFLDQGGLKAVLFDLGARLAAETVDILGNIEESPDLFDQSPIEPKDVDEFRRIIDRLPKGGDVDIVPAVEKLSSEDKAMLLKVALIFTPAEHPMISPSRSFMDRILEARKAFRQKVEAEKPEAFTFFEPESYFHSQTLMENIIYGHIRRESAGAAQRVNQRLMQLLIEENLLEQVVGMGLEFEVGSQGDRLSGGQRQKLALARAVLKDPPVLILDEATSALDNASQKRIQDLIERKWKGRATVIAVVHRLDTIKNFDRVAVMKTGRIIETGSYNELMERKGVLYELIHGKRQ